MHAGKLHSYLIMALNYLNQIDVSLAKGNNFNCSKLTDFDKFRPYQILISALWGRAALRKLPKLFIIL